MIIFIGSASLGGSRIRMSLNEVGSGSNSSMSSSQSLSDPSSAKPTNSLNSRLRALDSVECFVDDGK